jgi:hypothetical protein
MIGFRGFNSEYGKMGALIGLALIALLTTCAQSFPLHGGNGEVSATVYGTRDYEYGDGVYIDISADETDTYDVELIDDSNMTYSGDSGPYRSSLNGYPTETSYNGSIRDTLLFKAPNDAVIERLRIVPSQSDPFFINWTGVPEATWNNTTIRFYEARFERNGMRWLQGNWNLDINVTNSADHTAGYNNSDFAMVDQFGWVYQGEGGGETWTVLPGESLRFSIKVPQASEISRPVEIRFKGMRLDISAWT